MVTRFAPSPTGLLHLGHVRSAIEGWRRARVAGGRFLLRIEDIDLGRCRPEFTAAIEEDLRWLGLSWDGPVRVQSRHLPDYAAVLDGLRGRGLLYPCFCTRADVARAVTAQGGARMGPDGPVYPGTCRALPAAERARRLRAGEPHALRLDMARALQAVPGPLFYRELGGSMPASGGPLRRETPGVAPGAGRLVRCDPAAFGDVVLARKDVPASYHLCVTHDDALQGVTLVTRGEDLRPSTDLHRLLQALMGWPEPLYAHHPLLLGPDGQRLSKSAGSRPIRAWREAGASPQAVLALAESAGVA
ncbi:tRNA glutamyl-Q(34) synthetase GluQRS [Roseomonas elaeocarpi]|uniref:tRNA glutamyl-Q(34) synthetase GluQRS n=1 Tax=Roseomonas elaeocarpi TaxID=907779 RepID=A0ABV6JTH0_9PROT